MKSSLIEYEKGRAEIRYNHLRNILDWGEHNDYPQSVIDITNGSYKGGTCLDIYHKFIFGKGFADSDNYQIVVNEDGDTADLLLEKASEDYARFGGFALHINRNMLGQIVSLRYLPFENLRLCPDTNPTYKDKVALHPDWGHRTYKSFQSTPIEYFYLYDPSLVTFHERIAEAGGIYNYTGEVFYYSNRRGNYPLPIYDSVLTDMATQEAMSNISYRSAKKCFLPSGCFVEFNEFYDDNNQQDHDAFESVSDNLREMQGDKSASSVMHIVVSNKDNIPQFVQMRGENFDKEYEVTREAVNQAIGQAFRQPEELRCEKTASGFATDTMVQAYRVYNSMTEKERQVLERQFTYLFKNWHQPIDYNFQIQPLSYGSETILSRLGADTTTKVVEIATNAEIDINQRKALLTTIYGLEVDEANNILLIHADND